MEKRTTKDIETIACRAQKAFRESLSIPAALRNKALLETAKRLLLSKNAIISGNKKDIAAARKAKENAAFIDRLTLDEKRIQAMADSLREIAGLANPLMEVMRAWKRPNGLWIHKVRVPIGVVAIIYESRPNVTSDCAGLCLKSGNSVILRGGSEALNSNSAIFRVFCGVLHDLKLPMGLVNLIESTDRGAVKKLLGLNSLIDLVIPRGGEGLIRTVTELSTIPVIKHYKGICHVYVDSSACKKMAGDICFNAKVQRPGVCNAMETMLVHRKIAAGFLPGMLQKFREAGVEIRGCAVTQKIAGPVRRATELDYRTEYLDLKLSVKVVDSLGEAIEHVNTYGSHHSDSIVTEDCSHAMEFLRRVDSACVYVNASTRFTDGYQFGMGAEIGISTDKLHARGPMALEELTTYKYMVLGSGQVRT